MKVPKAFRSLASRPIVPIVAVATLTLGLGVNTAIFSLTREILLRPLPYKDADRLVRIYETSQTLGRPNDPIAPANFVAWRSAATEFEELAPFRRVQFNVSLRTTAVQVEGFQIDSGFARVLGIEPAVGRGFTNDDTRPGRGRVVLLSDGFWRRQFAADPSIVGQSLTVDGAPCTVVGILPATFKIYHVLNHELELFQPLVIDPTDTEHSLNLYAKLKPGSSVARASAQMETLYLALPVANHIWSAGVQSLASSFAAQSRSILLTLQWAVAVVLLIACANIANMLLAASAGRQKELAIRQALGAGPWRIARDLAGETLVVTLAGGALAVLLAAWIDAVLNSVVSFGDVNRLQPFRVDLTVLAFSGTLTFVVGTVFSLLPARAAAQTNVIEALKDSTQGVTSGASNRGLRHLLVVGELALSIVLTASALSLTRSALALNSFARGVSTNNVMTAQVALNDPGYADAGRLARAAAMMVTRLRETTGISDAALVNYAPVAVIRVGVPVTIEGLAPPPPDQLWIARYWTASPSYFRTVGIPIVAGRDFTPADDSDHPGVAIVSENFARRFWNSTDVIGRRIRTNFPLSLAFWIPRARREPLSIVGVVADVREDGLPDSAGYPQLYLPYGQNPTVVVTLIARTAVGPPEKATAAIRDAVRAADPQAPISYEMSFDNVIRETFARPREMAWLIGAFAGIALLLSAVGVYGVMAYLTAARSREIGIRIALGARRIDIVSLIVGHAMMLTVVGVAIGAILAPLALRLTSGLLFGVGPFDPVTLGAVALLLAGVSIAASAIPAARAARLAATSFR
ncbi:MAG TPA: ABC transporter permease [Vicinamibacterales bacterium]|nr:ABC transporter permease [Vicinamibacterales bacterium]